MNLQDKTRLSEPPGSVTDKPASTHVSLHYRDSDADPERIRWAADEIARRLEIADNEAADVRRYTATAPIFDPYAGEPVRVLTDAEQNEARRIIGACTNVSVEETRSRTIGTFCRRAVRRFVADAETGEPVARFLACKSRTCADCRDAIDRADAQRIAAAIGRHGWISEIAADRWGTVGKRLRRHGAAAARVPSTRDPLKIVVVADEQPTPDAVRVADVPSLTVDLMAHRPTGQARCLTTINVETRDAWEGRPKAKRCAECARLPKGQKCAECLEGWMAPTVQPADVERVAATLGIPTETVGASVRLRCKWDDWRAVAVRRWCQNPAGKGLGGNANRDAD